MTLSPQKKPDYQPNAEKKKKGLIIVYTGDGKGKTTAAFGMAFRAAGQGMSVVVAQFMKGKWKSGEVKAAEALKKFIKIYSVGEGFTWETKNREKDKDKIQKTWDFSREAIESGKCDVIILDEINYAIDYGYLDLKDVMQALEQKPKMLHIVLTGRNAKPELIEIADLVTEMKTIKHPFTEQGMLAQTGIDF
jgi:cob(I)alamin adenosyltransferase